MEGYRDGYYFGYTDGAYQAEADAEEEHECNYVESDYWEPDCYSDGYTTYTCSECGDSYDESISSYGHDYYTYDDGYSITYICSDCGDSYSEDYYYSEDDYEW